jgi:hypothetical protein
MLGDQSTSDCSIPEKSATPSQQPLRRDHQGNPAHHHPPALVSLIGHSLGYWPRESRVCISLQENRMGAALRLDLPSTSNHAPPTRDESADTSAATRTRQRPSSRSSPTPTATTTVRPSLAASPKHSPSNRHWPGCRSRLAGLLDPHPSPSSGSTTFLTARTSRLLPSNRACSTPHSSSAAAKSRRASPDPPEPNGHA